jgi:hypothetical protein
MYKYAKKSRVTAISQADDVNTLYEILTKP